jgi:hypothetical protein
MSSENLNCVLEDVVVKKKTLNKVKGFKSQRRKRFLLDVLKP